MDKLKILRGEAVNESAKLPKDFWLAGGNDFGAVAGLFWERELRVREYTRDLLQKLERLRAAQDDLRSKLTVLESRLYNVAESQPP